MAATQNCLVLPSSPLPRWTRAINRAFKSVATLLKQTKRVGSASGMPHIVHVRFDAPVPRSRQHWGSVECARAILATFAIAVDQDSDRGFYANFFGTTHLIGDFPGALRRMQLEILKFAGLSVSLGAARSKVVATIASRFNHPSGLRIVAPGSETSFLAASPIEAFLGINHFDAADLRQRGVATVAELRRVPRAALQAVYGQAIGDQIWCNSRGFDHHPALS
ncbi:MAG TPA: hypothetical protein VIW23_06425 [Candidatus Acidoferrum sp.]